ncbi:MAG: hypothetical protein QF886_18050, partial [Planctomycetota bacterium]|nr:hypothetical protein [Planctomycetota bacterium]
MNDDSVDSGIHQDSAGRIQDSALPPTFADSVGQNVQETVFSVQLTHRPRKLGQIIQATGGENGVGVTALAGFF